jgi:hypothetical protein
MSGRMNLIVVGTGEYQHWPELKFIRPHNDRFMDYVAQYWPDPRIIKEAALEPLPAKELRSSLRYWLTSCQNDDDVILLWSGHGQVSGSKHRLITFESPFPGHATLSSENSVTTEELADYLIQCPARRIVVLVNTCWSGDGGQQLAGVIGNVVSESLSTAQDRSMAIISSARREESKDGAFLSKALAILRAEGPPTGLAAEHRWEPSEPYLSPERLCAAVNVLLVGDDHQAQLHPPYGFVGGFFRRMRRQAAAPELPARVVAQLFVDFPDHLSGPAGPWDVGRVRETLDRSGEAEPSGELAFRLDRLALALSVLALLERWLGSSAGLANRLEPAWRSVLSPIHRIPRPHDRFGFVEQVALHGRPAEIIEFTARVIREAGDDPCDDRLYQWAQQELRVDRQVIDDGLGRLSSRSAQNRMIINFGWNIAASADEDAVPCSVIAWICWPDGRRITSPEYPFEPPYDVADMVAALVAWARDEVGDIEHLDVALPVSLFRSPTRPEEARIKLRGSFTRPVVTASGLVVRWADRITHPELRSDGLKQANAIAVASDPLCWVDRSACAGAQDLFDHLAGGSQAVGFTFEPEDLGWFYAAAYNSPYLLWTDTGIHDDLEVVQREVRLSWPNLPRRLSDVYKSAEPAVVRSVRAVWDDPDWLENVVPQLLDSRHRLRI